MSTVFSGARYESGTVTPRIMLENRFILKRSGDSDVNMIFDFTDSLGTDCGNFVFSSKARFIDSYNSDVARSSASEMKRDHVPSMFSFSMEPYREDLLAASGAFFPRIFFPIK